MSNDAKNSLLTRVLERVLPTSPDFFTMLAEQSKEVNETVTMLVAFFETRNVEAEKKIHQDEHAADKIKVNNIRVLNEAFSTPMDREDIYRAIMNLDEIVNYCKDTVNEMAALNVVPDQYTIEIANALSTGTTALSQGFARLQKETALAARDAEIARKADRKIEKIYRRALADLFIGDDFINMFKKREIYRHLTMAGERMAHCAATLNDIVVKMI